MQQGHDPRIPAGDPQYHTNQAIATDDPVMLPHPVLLPTINRQVIVGAVSGVVYHTCGGVSILLRIIHVARRIGFNDIVELGFLQTLEQLGVVIGEFVGGFLQGEMLGHVIFDIIKPTRKSIGSSGVYLALFSIEPDYEEKADNLQQEKEEKRIVPYKQLYEILHIANSALNIHPKYTLCIL
jgi:hypothetical protein